MMRQQQLPRLLVIISYVSTIVVLFYLPPSSAQSQVRTDQQQDQQERRLQPAFLPTLSRFASELNSRLYNGALTTQELLNRIDANEANNPDSLLARAKSALGQSGRSSSKSDASAQQAVNELRPSAPSSSSATEQSPGVKTLQTESNSQRSTREEAPQTRTGRFGNLLSGFNALLNAIHSGADQRVIENESPPQIGDVLEHEKRNRPSIIQNRLNRLAESFKVQQDSPPSPSQSSTPTASDALTLGPLPTPPLLSGFELQDPSDDTLETRSNVGKDASKSLESSSNEDERDDCYWQMETVVDGQTHRVVEDIPDAHACKTVCQQSHDCRFFSYSSSGRQCSMFNQATSLKKAEGTLSGPSHCSLLLNQDDFRFWPRRLQESQFSAFDLGGSQPGSCILVNTTVLGHQFYVLEGIVSTAACQRNCAILRECRFFTYSSSSQNCHLFDRAIGVDYREGVTSGPKSCIVPGTRQAAATTGINSNVQFTGPVVQPGQEIKQEKNVDAQEELKGLGNQGTEGMLTGAAGSAAGGGAGSGLLGGGGLLGNGLLSRLGLGSLASQIFAGEREAEEIGESVPGAASLLKTFHTVMGAGETVMKTFPVAEMVKTGYELSNSGLLQRQPRIGSKKDATGPPVGIAAPEVACLSEGMRCCVPRVAAPKYQLDPPKLNGVDNPRCTATYVSQWDSLCTTTKYDGDECETTIVETDGVMIYRNVMVMPGKTMNNAICECTVSKQGGDTQSSGKWEYSLALKEEAEATKQRNKDTVNRLANAAKVAMQWNEALGGSSGGGGGSGGNRGGSPSGFLNSLLQIASSFDGGRTSENVPNTRGGGSNKNQDDATSNLNTAALALLDALKEIKENSAERPRKRKLQGSQQQCVDSQDTGHACGHACGDACVGTLVGDADPSQTEHRPVVPVPLNCSVWRQDCEHSFERLMFDEKCHSIKIVENGCPREDVEFELLREGLDSTKTINPTAYRFRLPSVLSSSSLGVTCEFVLLATESSQPSLCESGQAFPVPDHSPYTEWPDIRERGPLLEMLLELAPEDEVVHDLVFARSLLQHEFYTLMDTNGTNVQQTDDQAGLVEDQTVAVDSSWEGHETEEGNREASESASHIRGGEVSNEDHPHDSDVPTKRVLLDQPSLMNNVFLDINPTSLMASEGEMVSIIFDVPKTATTGKPTTGRWGKQVRVYSP